MPSTIKDIKNNIRMKIWKLLEESNVARFPRPVYGRIPNFEGAELAARKVLELPEWQRAKIVKINPDAPQYHVRLSALMSGKLLIVASPRLREGFVLLDPNSIPARFYNKAATIRGMFAFGRKLSLRKLMELGSVDVIIEGSVAVSVSGNRLGKGEGYAELEYAILRELDLVHDKTPIITTVHELQIVNDIPNEPWDVPVDVIVTPKRVIRVKSRREKPRGVLWEFIDEHKLMEIPILRELAVLKGLKLG